MDNIKVTGDWLDAYYLDNGVTIKPFRGKPQGYAIVIQYPNSKTHLEIVKWNILSAHANAIYFVGKTPIGAPLRLEKASFTETSYTIEQLQELPLCPISMLNFPYFAAQHSTGFRVHSINSDETFESNCPSFSDPNYQNLVSRGVVCSIGVGVINRFHGTKKLGGELKYSEFSKFFIFGDYLYTIQNIANKPVLFMVEIRRLSPIAINLDRFSRFEHTPLSSQQKRHANIRFISSSGVMVIDSLVGSERETIVLNLTSSMVQQRREISRPLTDNAAIRNDDGIEELRRRNETLEQLYDDLQEKYNRLIMADLETPLRRNTVEMGAVADAERVETIRPRVPRVDERRMSEISLKKSSEKEIKGEEKLTRGSDTHPLRREVNLNNHCLICLEAEPTIAFTCGHRSCDDCSRHLKVCHSCRTPIKERIRLF